MQRKRDTQVVSVCLPYLYFPIYLFEQLSGEKEKERMYVKRGIQRDTEKHTYRLSLHIYLSSTARYNCLNSLVERGCTARLTAWLGAHPGTMQYFGTFIYLPLFFSVYSPSLSFTLSFLILFRGGFTLSEDKLSMRQFANLCTAQFCLGNYRK